MENSYGVGVGNRFELFYVDEEAGNPTNKIIKKAKQQKKLAAPAASTNVAANGGTIKKYIYTYIARIEKKIINIQHIERSIQSFMHLQMFNWTTIVFICRNTLAGEFCADSI